MQTKLVFCAYCVGLTGADTPKMTLVESNMGPVLRDINETQV